jgi:uncharacterized protein (DUF58 family)
METAASQHEFQAERASPAVLERQFEIAVQRLADDLRFGFDSSPYLGSGVDYMHSRPYVAGDSAKDIDWKVTARTQRYHIKQYESLKSTPIYLVVDTSASMAVSSRPLSKYQLAVLLAGGLALAGLRRLSPVGVLAGGERSLHVEPSLSRPQVFLWLNELRKCRYDEATRLGQRLEQLSGHLVSRTLVVVLSDLHDAEAVRSIKRLAAQRECVAIQLEDPAERGRLRGGLIRGVEAETGRTFIAHGFTRWFKGKEAPPAAELRRAGIDHLLLSTAAPFVAPLRRFLRDRGGPTRNVR